jgi:6-phosphogluconolactonase
MEMELVHAPVPELKELLSQSFEEVMGAQVASCALSGGPSALIFLPALRAANVDWSGITLFWADELFVPPDDPESNYGIAERMLLAPLGAKAPRALRMPTDIPIEQAAIAYDQVLEAELPSGALDLAILGVGEDGHLCALFKPPDDAQAGTDASRRVLVVEDAPRPPTRRLTLSLPFLLQAQHIWLIAVGARKLPVLHAALSRTQRATPLDAVLQQGKDVTVFTDQVIRRR